MKITDDMLTEWRKQFEAWALSDGGYSPKDLELFNGQYIDEHANTAFDAWQAARRTTPDREAVIDKSMVKRLMAQHGLTHDRDTLIEEIAEMVDHMGEGRRLEEYVGAIREMKSDDKGDA
ncbi:hypothetical protein [Burkholderia vietnamiensis]|jgi:hypothetical protein|uniref:hypothetical protein n=1 Tax=Burkholderia vietnamiensis TaxID=60552 RepID=UPI001040EFF8|nr:hypothetical protein [Burkholderia vietnamiensis]